MPKHTFDQVSAVLWGPNTLDYLTNYVLQRTSWDDSDIRDEAVYYAGMAHGLQLGALQKPAEQAILSQEGRQDSTLRNPFSSDVGGHGDGGVDGNDGFGGGFLGTGSQMARSLRQMDQVGIQRLASVSASRDRTMQAAGTLQRAGFETAKEATEKSAEQTGTASAPNTNTLTANPTDALASQIAAAVPPKKRKSILAPLLIDHHHDKAAGNDVTFTPGKGNEEDFDETMVHWLGDGGAKGWDFDS